MKNQFISLIILFTSILAFVGACYFYFDTKGFLAEAAMPEFVQCFPCLVTSFSRSRRIADRFRAAFLKKQGACRSKAYPSCRSRMRLAMAVNTVVEACTRPFP